MGTYAAVIAQINTILSSATDVGTKIYNYDRLENNEADFKKAFKDTTAGYIKAWSITRSGPISETDEAGYQTTALTTWLIRGYFSYKLGVNNREPTMQVIVDNIRDVFRKKPKLNDVVITTTGIQVNTIEPRVFAGVLVHYIEMTLGTEEQHSRL